MPASPLQRTCSKKRMKQYSSRAGPEAHCASKNPVSCFLWLFNKKTPQNTHISPRPPTQAEYRAKAQFIVKARSDSARYGDCKAHISTFMLLLKSQTIKAPCPWTHEDTACVVLLPLTQMERQFRACLKMNTRFKHFLQPPSASGALPWLPHQGSSTSPTLWD